MEQKCQKVELVALVGCGSMHEKHREVVTPGKISVNCMSNCWEEPYQDFDILSH